MKLSYIKLAFFLLSLSITLSCQENTIKSETNFSTQEIDPPPPLIKIKQNNIIGFACYESGSKSETVMFFTELLFQKDYKTIKDKLSSYVPAEKYLATILCEKLSNDKIITITDKELHQININKSSQEIVTICTGCFEDNLTILEMFLSDENYYSDALEEWYLQFNG